MLYDFGYSNLISKEEPKKETKKATEDKKSVDEQEG
jgi:hypothetical protein